MWIALAGCYESLKKYSEAIKCHEQVYDGDKSDISLFKIATLNSIMGEAESALKFFRKFIDESEVGPMSLPLLLISAPIQSHDTQEFAEACLFMAVYFKSKGSYHEAKTYALRLLEFSGPEREEAKALLRELKRSRS